MAWTTADLITNVKVRGFFPDTWSVTDAEILAVADGELRNLFSLVVGAEEEYYITYADQALVSGTALYRIPARAVLGRVRDVVLVDPQSNEYQLAKVPVERVAAYNRFADWTSNVCFSLRGDKVMLSPVPTTSLSGWSLRVYYYRRPNRLVLTSAAMQITAISSLTLSGAAPASWTTSNTFDLIQANPNFDWLDVDRAITAVTASTSIVLSAAPSSEVAVGDWAAKAGETPVVQIPELLHGILEQSVCVRLLNLTGDREAAASEKALMDEQLTNIRKILEPRAKASTHKVISRFSPLRRGRQ